jgi:DNA-binding PadR family transcriptional regulator
MESVEGTVSRMLSPATQPALSAGDAVLGLLIERPGNSYQLERRLEHRFGSAGFAHGSAYHAIRRLSKRGLIRPVEASPQLGEDVGGIGGRAATAYEATPRGVEFFRRWLSASSSIPPVREELLAKISFCGPADLPRMVAIVREAELACTARLNELNRRVRAQRRIDADDPWRRLMTLIVAAGDAAWWDARIKWLQDLRTYLQREALRYQAGDTPSSRPPRD